MKAQVRSGWGAAGVALLFAGLATGCQTHPAQTQTGAQTGMQPAGSAISAVTPAKKVLPHAHIYPEISAAPSDLASAMKKAKHEHKRVLVDFGGDWCGDCQVLNLYFHKPENEALLDKNFVRVNVNVGHIDQNLELGTKYGVDLKKGVPALAVLQPDGDVVYGQKGQFSDMRNMESTSVHDFLEKWR